LFGTLTEPLKKHERKAVILEELQERDMSTIGPVYPAHVVVSHAEVKLVADETANANTSTIKSDQQPSKRLRKSRRHRRKPT
jgi:hypothetical protein